MLYHNVTWNGVRLATLVPISPAYRFVCDEPVANKRYGLSRFAYFHKDGEQLILESPLAHAKMVLHDWRATALLHALARPRSLEELCCEFPDLPKVSVSRFLGLLLGCNFLSGAEERSEEETQALAQWDFHDLLFHSRSRPGRHAHPCGATFRFLDKIDPLPAVKPPGSDEAIHLYKPGIQALKEADLPFTRVLEERRSIREHGEQPITAKHLGEFLYRTARIRGLFETNQEAYERSDRPYPSGGACYELELYSVVHACSGLSPGLYHYCPKGHQLYKVASRTRHVDALLKEASCAAATQALPQVLIILAARFQRVTWKYEAIAYSLILKHVGVLYQTMYLVATAMRLAPCALGSGNADLFSEAAGTDYCVETSVGEFMLGSRADG